MPDSNQGPLGFKTRDLGRFEPETSSTFLPPFLLDFTVIDGNATGRHYRFVLAAAGLKPVCYPFDCTDGSTRWLAYVLMGQC